MEQAALMRLLHGVEKPARYIGGEWNSIAKERAQVRFALCFPDVYEIGMSHLGSKILYHVLNSREDTACERVYAPWPDMERALRKADLPLCSLETKRPLASFDIVGFSLLYEMCYTNILAMLDLAGIPLRAAQRGADAPLIVCGGPCACNPEPLAPFMDAVMIGDGEELIGKLVDAQRAARAAGEDKHGLLRRLAGIDGIVCSQPEGAFYAFPDISAFGLTSQEFCEQLLERQKVVCIPGSAFGACGEGHIRVAYTCEEGMLQAAVERLHQFCREVRGA